MNDHRRGYLDMRQARARGGCGIGRLIWLLLFIVQLILAFYPQNMKDAPSNPPILPWRRLDPPPRSRAASMRDHTEWWGQALCNSQKDGRIKDIVVQDEISRARPDGLPCVIGVESVGSMGRQ